MSLAAGGDADQVQVRQIIRRFMAPPGFYLNGPRLAIKEGNRAYGNYIQITCPHPWSSTSHYPNHYLHSTMELVMHKPNQSSKFSLITLRVRHSPKCTVKRVSMTYPTGQHIRISREQRRYPESRQLPEILKDIILYLQPWDMATTCHAVTSVLATQISRMESTTFRYSCANLLSMIQSGDVVAHVTDIPLHRGFHWFHWPSVCNHISPLVTHQVMSREWKPMERRFEFSDLEVCLFWVGAQVISIWVSVLDFYLFIFIICIFLQSSSISSIYIYLEFMLELWTRLLWSVLAMPV